MKSNIWRRNVPEIYLDNNATTLIEPKVIEAMSEVYEQPLNPSSSHRLGRKARGIIENSRSKILKMANAYDSRLIFTATGTEANNLAIKGLPSYIPVVSAIEHPSILKTARGIDSITVPVTKDGIVNIDAMDRLLSLRRGKFVISVMLANNETGIIQPIKEVVKVAKKYGAIVHCDAIQCFGKIDVNMEELDVDMMTISAHKFGGPQGAAALIVRKSVPLSAHIIGGGQEQSFRAGTENVAAIHGFGVAAEINSIDDSHTLNLRNLLEKKIKSVTPECKIFGRKMQRLPNTSYITMPNVSSETQLIHFDMDNIAVSAGSACSSGKIEVSHVLRAMEVDENLAKTAIRISLCKYNTEDDINAFISSWQTLYYKVNASRQAA